MSNYQQTFAREFAERIKALGFAVYLAEHETYGYITDDTESRVLSFEGNGSLGGAYGPPSQESGTGWKLDRSCSGLETADNVRNALYSLPPFHCGKGWSYLSTVAQYRGRYQNSSRFTRV